MPPGSSWTSGPHWHAAHAEFLQVVSGRARVTLAGRDLVVGAGAGVVAVPRGVVHEWRRADCDDGEGNGNAKGEGREEDGEDGEEELVVREWTEPKDGAKEVFFRNLNGLILDEAERARSSSSSWSGAVLELELWNLFWRADNYPVVLGGGWLGGAATRVLMGAAVALGWVMGCPGVYEEYSAR